MRGVGYASDVITTTGGIELLALTAPAGASIEILRAEVTGDSETNTMILVELFRCTSVSGGTAATEKETEENDQAPSGTVVTGATTITPTGKETDPVYSAYAPSTGGWVYAPTPEERIVIPPNGDLLLSLTTGSLTSQDFVASLTWREIG